jgi:hypothetical protein
LQYAGAGAGVGTGSNATFHHPSIASTSPLTQAQHQAYAAAALQAAQWSSSYNPGTFTSTIAITPKTKSSWPLVFETNGASYIYQQQSGLFYDSVQRYFYCPKSKQYYNEVDGTYWIQSKPQQPGAAGGGDAPFIQFFPSEPDDAQPIEDLEGGQHSNCNNQEVMYFLSSLSCLSCWPDKGDSLFFLLFFSFSFFFFLENFHF